MRKHNNILCLNTRPKNQPNMMSENGPTQRGNSTRGNKNNNNSYQRSQRNDNNKMQLRGTIDELKNNMYYIGNFKQSDNYDIVMRNIFMYIQCTMDHGDDIVTVLIHKKDVYYDKTIANLQDVKSTASKNKILAGQQCVQKIIDREGTYEINKTKAFGIIYGQCTKGMQNKLEECKDYLTKLYNNPIKTLEAIKELCYGYQLAKYPMLSVINALKALCNIRKHNDESLNDYQHRFSGAQDIFYSLGGCLIFQSSNRNVKSTDIWSTLLDMDDR